MSPIRASQLRHHSTREIPRWVPLAIIGLFFLLIFAATRYSVRGLAVYRMWKQGENWDASGVLIQDTRYSCVPCSLTMLLKDEGFDVTAARIAWMAGTDFKGTNPEGIIQVGTYYGYHVREETMGFEELLEADAPAIIYFTWDGILHAVYALPDRTHHTLIIKNPAEGLQVLYKDQVMDYFGVEEWDVYLFE